MIEPTSALGRPAMRLAEPGGAQAVVLLHGAQVVSWRPAGDVERLYVSPDASVGDASPVRGGIPVCFPQFAARGRLPQHGFARTATWRWVEGAVRGGAAIGVLALSHADLPGGQAPAAWPHRFTAELTLAVAGTRLDVELAVSNDGDAPLDFTAALHGYLRVDDLERARLHGVGDTDFDDMVAGASHRQELDPIGFVGEVDRLYRDVRWPLRLASGLGPLELDAEGFADAVVWNPGAAKSARLGDLPAGGWRDFVCVEAGAIARPVVVAPGQTWSARQSFDAG